MLYLSKIKNLLCLWFFVILFFHLSYPIIAEANATENRNLRLVTEIKEGLKELEQIRESVASKYPCIKEFESKERIFGYLGDFFRKDSKNYDDYIKTLTPGQRKDFYESMNCLIKEDFSKRISSNDEIIKMMETLKKYPLDGKSYLRLLKFYNAFKEMPSDSEKNKCQMLKEKLNIPEPVIDYRMTYAKYQSLYDLYLGIIMVINDPVKQKRIKINLLLNELTISNKNESDKMVQKEITAFIEKSRKALPLPTAVPSLGGTYYYNIKLFSECMQSPQRKELIKKALQESKLMRKGIASLIIGSRINENTKKDVEKFDYDNFDKYWSYLQEISIELPEKAFPGMKKRIEESPAATVQATNAQYFLECFFTPYLIWDKS